MLFASEIKDWADVAERLGIPFAILLMVFLLGMPCLWLCIKWLGRNVAEPLVASHLALVDAIRKTNENNTEVNQQNADTSKRLATAYEGMAGAMKACKITPHAREEPGANGNEHTETIEVRS